LRNAPGKTRAVIYDFLVSPPDLGGGWEDAAFNLERLFFQRELRRIVENGPEALHSLHDLRLNYHLLADQ